MTPTLGSISDSVFSAPGAPTTGMRTRQDEMFNHLLTRAREGAGADEIRTSAEQLVSATFLVPMLASVRESSMAAEPFAPTPGEKQFGALLDQRVADEIVKSSNLPIVDRLVRDIGMRQRMAPAASSTIEVSA